MRHGDRATFSRLARVAAAPRLGLGPARLGRPPDRPRPRCLARRRQWLGGGGAGGGGRCAAVPPAARHAAQALLSVMGAVTPWGQVYTLVRQRPLTGLDTVAFLEHVGREVGGPVQIVWDRSPIHRRAEVGAFVEAVGGDGLAVASLPAHAPD